MIASLPAADFDAPVTAIAAAPTAGQAAIGRRDRDDSIDWPPVKTPSGREQADVLIPDKTISRLHAQIEIVGDGTITVEDLGSTNGTQVNGERLTTAFPQNSHRGRYRSFRQCAPDAASAVGESRAKRVR